MGLDHEKLKRSKSGSRGGFGWKPKSGDQNKVRILPPHSKYLGNFEAIENLALPYKVHFIKIEGRQSEVSLCLQQLRQRCPVCEVWGPNRKTTDPALKQIIKDIGPTDQYLFNMLDHNNLQAGIQPWAANWTCWDKIMEIAANPQWGNVVDPSDGVDFQISLTPGEQSRTGYNSYSVLPSPQRTNFLQVLQAIPNWEAELDKLESFMPEPKDAEELRSLMSELNLPGTQPRGAVARTATTAPQNRPVTPAAGAPAPVAAPTPVAAPVAAPAAAPVPMAAPAPVAAPVPVAAPASVAPPAGAATARSVGFVTPTAATAVHYTPPAGYEPITPAEQRPLGAPICFADYDPQRHQCGPCPVMTECQNKCLGLD